MGKALVNFLAWTRNANPAQVVGTLVTLIPVVILSLEQWIKILETLQQLLLGLLGGTPPPPIAS